jgi:hypothetical protein
MPIMGNLKIKIFQPFAFAGALVARMRSKCRQVKKLLTKVQHDGLCSSGSCPECRPGFLLSAPAPAFPLQNPFAERGLLPAQAQVS